MDDKQDKINMLNQDLILENSSISNKIYNYFYNIVRTKKETSFLELYILYILETIQLISYGLSQPHTDIWKENNSSIKKVSDIISILRISSLMKYVKFYIYLIIFFILVFLIFSFCVFLIVNILFFKPDSKFFSSSISIIRNIIYPLYIFFYIPITELVLLPLKCNSENKVDIVKDGIKCWESLHYLYSILGIISSVLFFLCMIFLLNLYFYPFNYHDSSIRIRSDIDNAYLFIKYIFVLRYTLVKNEYLSIAILFILSLYALIEEFKYNSYNNNRIEIVVNLRNSLVLWTYFMLLIAKFFQSTQINGIIYIFCLGIPIVIICFVLLVNENKSNLDYNIRNYNNTKEYLVKVRNLIKLVTSFIKNSKTARFGAEVINQKEDILLKGIIKIHSLECIKEDCPLTKFMENNGNYNIQKQCILNYMTIYFNSGMKRFPFSSKLILYNIHFNFTNRINMNSVRNNISLLQNSYNTHKTNFLLFMLSKDIRNMKSKDVNGDSSDYEQEHEILNQKYRRLRYLIENSTKLYGEFWGIFATNLTNNLNTFKLYNLGQKLNLYLKEMDILWNNELKNKKVDSENQVIIQLYSRFLLEILWNKKKSEEISKKLNEEDQRNHDSKKKRNKNTEINNIEEDLESPNYIIYCTSDEKGDCSITHCTNSIANLLGYMKIDVIGKKIEVLMPEIFKSGHSIMLTEKIRQIHLKRKSDRNSYRENEKKKNFVVAKSKMGYLIPLVTQITINEDSDFSNSFIIKAYLEAKDTKSVYAYYILTKPDLTICSISSSAINLGLTMDILNKYAVNIEYLIREKNYESIDFIRKINEYEEELKEVIWIYPDLIYPKNKIYDEIKKEELFDLIKSSYKKKIYIQISTMKFGETNLVGYVFKIVDTISKKKNEVINPDSFIPKNKKEILFDLLSLNYIRTETVKKKIGNRNLREKEDNIENEKQLNKANRDKNKKITNISNVDEIIESSEENKKINVELTKEKILELQTKSSKDIQDFIELLPFFGEEIFVEKMRPNKEKYAIGKNHDALIKISIANFVTKIEQRINSNPELLRRLKGIKKDETKENDVKNEINHGFTSDISASLANIFKSKSIAYIKLISLIFFGIFFLLIIFEFIFTILNVGIIKSNIVKMKNAYQLLESICFIKYLITEAVLTNKYKDEYIILTEYKMTKEENIDYLKWELEALSQDFRSIYDDFASTSPSEFSKNYQNYVSSNTQVLVYSISNGEKIDLNLPYSVAMNRIPNSVYYISTIMDESIEINMEERNTYELIYNLLNGYYASIRSLTLILAEDAVISSKTSIVGNITFYSSFVFTITFLIIIWHLLTMFLMERQKPINLFLTIKKQIFEDLKNASDDFSNKLLNKLFGNEDNEEQNQKDYQANIREKDINIIKFKSPHNLKKNDKHNEEQLRNFIKLILFFIIIEAYIMYKYFYAKEYIDSVKKFLDVFNITLYSYIDITTNIDISKSFFYDKTIPLFKVPHSNQDGIDVGTPFYNFFYNLSHSFDEMIIATSNTKSFLKLKYKDNFAKYVYQDFSEMIKVNTTYVPNESLLKLFQKGFKPVVFNVFERLRFFWIKAFLEEQNSIQNRRWCDIDFLLLYVIRPWYNKLIEIMHEESNHFLNGARVVQISLFIVVLVVFILCYFIIWKSYEENLSILLQRSFDLIKLIPEEIKYIIVSKLNE